VSFDAWLLFASTDTVLSLTPGPAVLLVVSLGMARGSRAGLRASLGVLAANAIYFALSATGIGTLLLASWELFFAVKWLGAAYLVGMGLRMLSGHRRESTAGVLPAGAGFRHGFLVNAANPKLLVYFMAILPQFIDPEGPLALQVLVLGVTSMSIEAVVLAGYAALASRSRRYLRTPGAMGFVERLGGGLLVAAAARVAALRRGDPAAVLP
jgi:threonine/homoserine/homoserine lactone efflux protein